MKPVLARILLVPLAKVSPGGTSEFVQSVPVNVAASLMRFCSSNYSVALVAY